MQPHDFVKFPELANSQFDFHYFSSPHKQITEDFRAKVERVIDGDTIELDWHERDFFFPIRLINIAAPEIKENGGKESKSYLEGHLLGTDVDIIINPDNRVDKWGRLLGNVISAGLDVGEMSIVAGHSVPWGARAEGQIPTMERLFG